MKERPNAGLKVDFLTSTKATASSVAARVATATAATVAAGAPGGLTVVLSTKTTREPGQSASRWDQATKIYT